MKLKGDLHFVFPEVSFVCFLAGNCSSTEVWAVESSIDPCVARGQQSLSKTGNWSRTCTSGALFPLVEHLRT